MRAFEKVGLVACVAVLLVLIAGCAKHEHREMTVHEEQHHGEVEPTSPGEMIVE